MAKTKVLICPYCGETQPASEECRACSGRFEALSRQATHNEMGPWFIRDEESPFRPGCSYETLVRFVEKGSVTRYTILRGPTTRQFWTVAKRVPGIAHLLGYCHECDAHADRDSHGCGACGAPFGAYLDRDFLGLPEVRPMPWEADLEEGARHQSAAQPQLNGGRQRARSMSSFATDEELLGRDGPDEATVSVAPPPPVRGGTSDESDPSPTVTVEDDYLAGAATRALQRALERQRRANRMLAVLLILTALSVIALSFLMWRDGQSSRDDPGTAGGGTTPPATRPEPATPRPDPPVVDPAAEAPVEPGPEPPDPEDADPLGDMLDGEGSASPDGPWQKQFDAAREVAATGADETVAAGERIEAYERALGLLAEIEANTDPGNRPAGFQEQKERIERDLERLRLKEFFPDG